MEDRLEFESFDQFLHLFFDTYEELDNCYGGDILLPKRDLLNIRKYYVIKADN